MGRQEPSVKYSISSISSLVSFNISESSLEKKTAGQSERGVMKLRNINLKLNCGGLEDIHPLKRIQQDRVINISNWWKRLMICLSFLKTGLNPRATILSFFKSTNPINEIK